MKIFNWVLTPWRKWKEHREFKKRLKELQQRDPFIYK
jgi:hypothetical protein